MFVNYRASFKKQRGVNLQTNHFQKQPRGICYANNRLVWMRYFMLQMSESTRYMNVSNFLASRSREWIGDIVWLHKSRPSLHIVSNRGRSASLSRFISPRSAQFSGVTCNFAVPSGEGFVQRCRSVFLKQFSIFPTNVFNSLISLYLKNCINININFTDIKK